MSEPALDHRSRVLILAPHPDDEVLAIGGLVARAAAAGAALRVLFITDGDDNPWPQRAIERKLRITPADRARWGVRRREEAAASLRTLGVPAEAVRFLAFPDQGITPQLLAGGRDLAARLAAELDDFRPTLLLSPGLDDLHPDHSAAAVILRLVLERRPGAAPPLVPMAFAVHYRGTLAGPDSPGVSVLRLTPQELETKRRAILCHATQMYLTPRRLMAHATGEERFVAPPPRGAATRGHPVRCVERQGDCWRLDLAMRASLGAFGPASLFLLVAPGDGGLGPRFRVDLPRGGAGHGREAPFHDLATGAVAGQARYRGGRSRGELFLPAALVPEAPRWFVKLERRHGFFDEAGWAEVAPPAAPPAEPSAAERLGVTAAPAPARATPVVCCVVPCYNVAGHCGEVVREAAGFADILVAVDDGSTDQTAEELRQAAAAAQARGRRVIVISLERNGGKGGALLAAFRHAVQHLDFDVLVTLDGDRQHRPADIPRLVESCTAGATSMAIGERFAPGSGPVPLRSRVGNTLATLVLRLRYPSCPRDTQSGLRAFRREFVEQIIRYVQPGRYETELQILLLALGQRRTIGSVPIPTIYLDGNRTSHFRPVHDAWRVYKVMLSYRGAAGTPTTASAAGSGASGAAGAAGAGASSRSGAPAASDRGASV